MRRAIQSSFFTFLLIISAAAQSQETAVTPPLVVTATRVPMQAGTTLQSVTVLRRDALEQSTNSDVLPTLTSEPGFEYAQNGGVGALGAVFLRGTDSDQNLVLVDGIRLNAATNGGSPLHHLMLNGIDKIEYVRGNVSSLYGSQAIGGVVQLFTFDDEPAPGATLSAGLGNLATHKGSVELRGGTNQTRFKLGTSYLETDGFSAVRRDEIPTPFLTRPEDTDEDAYRNTTFDAGFSHAWAEGQELRGTMLHTRARTEFDGTFENRAEQTISVFALNSVNRISPRWTSRITLGESANDSKNSLDQTPTSRFETRNAQFAWQNEFTIASGHTLLAGAEWLRQTVDATTTYDADARRVISPFVGYFAHVDRFTAEVSARHDDYSDIENATTGRLAIGFQPTEPLRLHAAVASAFKAPSFDDLYFPFFGNPDLRPERARSVELGLRWETDPLRFEALAFSNRLRDLITFDSIASKPINVDSAKNTGLELTLQTQIRRVTVRASATWQDPTNADTGERLLRRARWLGSLSLTTPVGAGSARLQMRTSGDRLDNSFDFTRKVHLGGYTLADIDYTYPIAKGTRLRLGVSNLFDKDYALAAGYNTTPRHILLELSHSM